MGESQCTGLTKYMCYQGKTSLAKEIHMAKPKVSVGWLTGRHDSLAAIAVKIHYRKEHQVGLCSF